MLAGLILAGGKSSRMGTDKSLLTLPSSQLSLLEHCQKQLALLCGEYVFISGSQHKKAIVDVIPHCGPLSGIHGAISYIQMYHVDVTEMLVVAIDMPNLCTDDFNYLLRMGRHSHSLCSFENCFLPLYIPLSFAVTEYLSTVLKHQSEDGVHQQKQRQYSVKLMLDSLKGSQISPLKNTQLNNINTPEQWQLHCTGGSLYQGMKMTVNKSTTKQVLNIAILTVSDTRNEYNDTSGQYLNEAAIAQGHNVMHKNIVIDDKFQIRAVVSNWIASDDIQVVLITGGTGFTARDTTPEAMLPLFEKEIEGFGELFRHVSYLEIGTSTVQSRALGGMANNTAIFCMPGSTGACKTAWNGILQQQLDSTHRPCNFVVHLKDITQCPSRG
jgi:molybdenum cofactor biosynthesis protein B